MRRKSIYGPVKKHLKLNHKGWKIVADDGFVIYLGSSPTANVASFRIFKDATIEEVEAGIIQQEKALKELFEECRSE